jgi:hypothetical protein
MSSTCDVMYCRQRRYLYSIMVDKLRNTICPPPPQISLHTRAALSSNSNGTRSVYNRKNPKSSLYCEMSMIQAWCRPIAAFLCPSHSHYRREGAAGSGKLHRDISLRARTLLYYFTCSSNPIGLKRKGHFEVSIWATTLVAPSTSSIAEPGPNFHGYSVNSIHVYNAPACVA